MLFTYYWKYPQPEKFSAYILVISLSRSFKGSAQTPHFSDCSEGTSKTYKSFSVSFSLWKKKILTEKETGMKDPYWQLLPRGSTLRFIYLRCSLRHRQFLSLCHAPQMEIWPMVIPNNVRVTSKNILVRIISFHKNLKFSSLQQDEASFSRVFQN